jgi:hypothetical protein
MTRVPLHNLPRAAGVRGLRMEVQTRAGADDTNNPPGKRRGPVVSGHTRAGTGPLLVEWRDIEFAVPVRTASDNVKANVYAGHLDHNPSEPEANSDLAAACTRLAGQGNCQRAGHRRLHREGATRPCLPEERGALKLGGNSSCPAPPVPRLPTLAALVSSPAMPPHPQQGIYSLLLKDRLPDGRGLSL